MQIVILAGGLGTRLRPLTDSYPKCMAPVKEKPFLSYVLRLLALRGADEAVLCTGYLGENIKAYFGNVFENGLALRYSQETNGLLGTGGALKLAEPLLAETFLILNGDTYLDVDYTSILGDFISSKLGACIVVSRGVSQSRRDIELDGQFVTNYDKTNLPAAQYVNAGLMGIRRDILSNLADNCPLSLESDILPPLIQARQVKAYLTEQPFYDIGTFSGKDVFENAQEGTPS